MKWLQALALAVVGVVSVAAVTTHRTDVRYRQTVRTERMQTIYVRNLSTFVTDKAVAAAMPAFQTATTRDYAPVWKTDARLVFIGHRAAPDGAIVVTLLDRSDIKDALAYHMVKDGVPAARVFVGTSRYFGYSWTVGFTHELFEMLADPVLVSLAQGWDMVTWSQEVADAVESDLDGYTIPGGDGRPVRISDFVTPAWYDSRTRGGYDFRNHVDVAEKVLPGGYACQWIGFTWNCITNFRGHRHVPAEPRSGDGYRVDVFWPYR